MAPSKSTRPTVSSRKSKSKLSKLTLDSFPSNARRSTPDSGPSPLDVPVKKVMKPLKSLAEPPTFQLHGKGKEKLLVSSQTTSSTDATADESELWVNSYAPKTETELAVHKRKVEDVRHWLLEAFEGGPTGALKRYRRILALTGNAGTGKTATLQVLAREMNFEILEWRNSPDDNFAWDGNDDYDRESLTKKFQTFLNRASSCRPLPLVHSTIPSSSTQIPSRQIILLEDLPNILHAGTADAFHAALQDYLASPPNVPIVLVISNAGTRGEDPETDLAGGRAWGRWRKEAIDVRSVIPHTILNSPYFREIPFNPIAPTILLKALTALLTKHFSTSQSAKSTKPTNDTVKIIVDSSNGDIRSAVMALQFACIASLSKRGKNNNMRRVLEAMTRREQSLALFHMLGKVLYNKRKCDPGNHSSTAKDREREEKLDDSIPDPPPLPFHLERHFRRSSRVDVNVLYADSPVDTSLFALYLHHNYAQFCNEVDECDAVCDWLSWIDASGPLSSQAQQNPHQFHILTLGVLHSLPSPVTRRSQKMFKPEFFDVLKRTRESEGCLTDTEEWLNHAMVNTADSGRRWAKDEVVLELGGVLKALNTCGAGAPPRNHSKFTELSFVHPTKLPSNSQRMEQLGESEEATGEATAADITGSTHAWNSLTEDKDEGGWLESDDIRDF
ncbi:Rad17 cell cycle checkpoint protein-domain-containing protein [Gautieria morchelliformis]|nr:Rad17 cell cycle checkpoint protein-domain-containing protein [Gautieria morchelliformis]